MGEGFRSGCEDRSHCAKFHPSAAFTALAVGLWFRRLGPFSFLASPAHSHVADGISAMFGT